MPDDAGGFGCCGISSWGLSYFFLRSEKCRSAPSRHAAEHNDALTTSPALLSRICAVSSAAHFMQTPARSNLQAVQLQVHPPGHRPTSLTVMPVAGEGAELGGIFPARSAVHGLNSKGMETTISLGDIVSSTARGSLRAAHPTVEVGMSTQGRWPPYSLTL